MLMRRTVVVAALMGTACPSAPPAPAEGKNKAAKTAAKEPSKADAEGPAKPKEPAPEPKAEPAPKPDAKAPGPMGKILDSAPIPLATFIGSPPAEAEKHLGDPVAKGGTKKSCVRFVPERTWFHCEHAWQRYADTTGTAESIHVTYEDGKVASVAFEKLAGEGAFDPATALTKVGLELAGEPTVKSPAENVKLYSWWNAQSKLLIGGRQYRVEVSTVDDSWDTSKVDLILNDPLNDDEESRVFEVKPQNEGG